MTVSRIAHRAGRLWGRYALHHFHGLFYRRSSTFDLHVSGAEHLRAATEGPCLIVANHVLLRPEDTLVASLLPPNLPGRRRLTHNLRLMLFYASPDSFLLHRIVREETGRTLRGVSMSNLGTWSGRALGRRVQAEVAHPFGNGMREGMGYIPVEYTGRGHRQFLDAVGRAVRQGEPVLIFPGTILWDVPWHPHDGLLDGNVSPGAAHLAAKYGPALLPAHISGGDSWRPGQAARVAFGPAFHAGGMTKAEVGRQIVARVRVLGESGPDGGAAASENAALVRGPRGGG